MYKRFYIIFVISFFLAYALASTMFPPAQALRLVFNITASVFCCLVIYAIATNPPRC